MPLHLKAGDGDLRLITEPSLLMRCAWLSYAKYHAALYHAAKWPINVNNIFFLTFLPTFNLLHPFFSFSVWGADKRRWHCPLCVTGRPRGVLAPTMLCVQHVWLSYWWILSTSTRMGRSSAAATMLRDSNPAVQPAMRLDTLSFPLQDINLFTVVCIFHVIINH